MKTDLLVAEETATASRLKEGAVDTFLNTFSILGEVVDDFRNSDRFFKYKAVVITLWFLFAVGAFGVACPTETSTNDINALLVVSGEPDSPIYMVKNESDETWQGVEILVNSSYRSTLSALAPKGGYITLSPAVLFDVKGKRAPTRLIIKDIVVKVQTPEAHVRLLRSGVPTETRGH